MILPQTIKTFQFAFVCIINFKILKIFFFTIVVSCSCSLSFLCGRRNIEWTFFNSLEDPAIIINNLSTCILKYESSSRLLRVIFQNVLLYFILLTALTAGIIYRAINNPFKSNIKLMWFIFSLLWAIEWLLGGWIGITVIRIKFINSDHQGSKSSWVSHTNENIFPCSDKTKWWMVQDVIWSLDWWFKCVP